MLKCVYSMPYSAGYEEDGLLRQLGLQPAQAEPGAGNCSQVLVWHTQTRTYENAVRIDKEKFRDTNLPDLLLKL